MTPIIIHTKPENTGRPADDFVAAVLKQEGVFRCRQLYLFGSVYVEFFEHKGKLGMKHMRPAPTLTNVYDVTRISSTNKRTNEGRVTISPN